MSRSPLLMSLSAALIALALFPDPLAAWSPGTHIFIGESVLASLATLPAAIAALLRSYPHDFLYGNIAADTSIAKKYAPVGRHCHSWHVGREILELAETPQLQAFAWGYLSHLAADTVAHNFFVPRQLVVTSRTIALGHSWWESRFETYLGDQYARTAMDLIRLDHSAADGHLDRILSPTIFSVRTSRRLFRGMVGVTETESWQRVFKQVANISKWEIPADDLDGQMGRAYQYVMELLRDDQGAAPLKLDPAGESSLQLAKKIRLDVVRNRISGTTEALQKLADAKFGLPRDPVPLWDGSGTNRPWDDG